MTNGKYDAADLANNANETGVEDLSDSTALVMLPCPLCGSNPELVDIAGWEIWCECGLVVVLESPDKNALVKHWNTRAT